MSKVSKLMTVSDLVDAFGGTNETAELLGVGASAVSNWITRGKIPARWYFELDRGARLRGYEVSDVIFRNRPSAGDEKMKMAAQRVA